ncbi:MAG: HupE/UreJ family protein [Candidatus Thiodiazotropha taylori]|nr:HupE/UreJ family protein [Candidatus Thiodiazotropha taylori]
MLDTDIQRRRTGHAGTVSCLAIALLALCALLPGVVLGHVEVGISGDGGFVSGLLHPVTGLDHVVAMVAVGLWGAILGAPAIWILPIAFPLIMTVGAVLGILDFPLPAIGIGIAASAIFLGGMVAANARPPLAIAFLAIAFFAIYHGHPHGAALPDFGVPLLYAAGFVVATGLLHVGGIAFGLLYRWPAGKTAVRTMGVGIAAVGGYFLLLAIGRGL